MIPHWLRRLYVFGAVAYIALGFVFVAQAYATWERMGAPITSTPVTKVPTGNDDKTVEAYYDYLQLRHLQQQTETYGVQATPLLITYGVLGATLLILFTMTWMWYAKRRSDSAGLYPIEVYNGYIAERGGPVEAFTYANYAVMVAFSAFYVWWDIVFGQWE
jgi:hypothetical protein